IRKKAAAMRKAATAAREAAKGGSRQRSTATPTVTAMAGGSSGDRQTLSPDGAGLVSMTVPGTEATDRLDGAIVAHCGARRNDEPPRREVFSCKRRERERRKRQRTVADASGSCSVAHAPAPVSAPLPPLVAGGVFRVLSRIDLAGRAGWAGCMD